MILADKIINERKKCGWSQEELAEKLGISRQSVSKWESAQSMPDLQRIIQMAELFGVSTDYLLKDAIEAPSVSDDTQSASEDRPLRTVSMEEANAFMNSERERAPKTALGVSLCISCSVFLILLIALSEDGTFGITPGAAVAVGVTLLLCMVAVAVGIFMTVGKRKPEFDFFETDDFETAYGVSGLVKEKRQSFMPKKTMYNTVGVILCILCAVPLVAVSVMDGSGKAVCIMVCVLLITVAAAVNLFVRAGIVSDCYDMLLQENEFTGSEKRINRKLAPLSGIYWGAATAVYLAVSFITDNWDRSWIIWPVAAVMFAVVCAIAKAVIKNRDDSF